jgi:beta-lactamase class A
VPLLLLRLIGPGLALCVLLAGCSIGGSSNTSDEPAETVSEVPASTPTIPPTPLTLLVDTPTPEPTAVPTETPEQPALEPTQTIIQTSLVSTIDTFLADEPGMYGVVILDADGQYLYSRNADVPFVAASLYKLVLLADIYARIESGELSLDMALPLLPEYFDDQFAAEDGFFVLEDEGGETTLEMALFGAGAYSSNIAAKVLLSLTSTASLRDTAERLEMWDTWFNVVPATDVPNWPDRYLGTANPVAEQAIAFIDEQAEYNLLHLTTPNDVAHYWRLLLDGQVISPESSAAILAILREQVVTDRIPYLLPGEYTTANKTGNLYHVVHDSGTIDGPTGTVIIAALSQNESDDDHGAQVIQRVALAAIGETTLPPFTTDHFSYPDDEATPEQSDD